MEYKRLIEKGKGYLTDVVDRYTSTHNNTLADKLSNMPRRTECPITGDTSYNSMLNVPIGERDGKQISVWMSANALESNSPYEISDKILYNLYNRLIDETRLDENRKKIKSGTRFYKRSEILNSLPEWEYIELGKENGFHYLKDLEGVLPVLSTDEYSEYLHKQPTEQDNERIRKEKENMRKILGLKKPKKGTKNSYV